MKTFISQCVNYLHEKYQNKISDINVILPSQRGKMFFNMSLSNIIKDKPIWQPKFISIDNIMEQYASLKQGDELRLLVELYNIYSKYHKEPFDKFYFWGEILINDFDMVDNYLIDAKALYSNIKDIKDIDAMYNDYTKEQIEIIDKFWGNVNNSKNTNERKKFFDIWNTLYNIYDDYRTRLKELGIGYNGMIYREAVEKTKNIDVEEKQTYAIIGFNALSNCEKNIFKHLQKNHNCDFLWDWDEYYTSKNPKHEAGFFIRENIKLFGEANLSAKRDNFIKNKEINIISSPTDALIAKHTWSFMKECIKDNEEPYNTAVIMTDENLLIPIIYSIPEEVDVFNVTSGYELRTTHPYSLVEELIALQGNIKDGKFYHKNIHNILTHNDIQKFLSDEEKQYIKQYILEATRENQVYDDLKNISIPEKLKTIFTIQNDNSLEFGSYLCSCINIIIEQFDEEDNNEHHQFYYTTINTIVKAQSLFEQCGMNISKNIYLSALRKLLSKTKVAFDGEPLMGAQVMGFLETRNIDFKNVLLLSVNEDNFPSKSIGKSFIPPNLRVGYGLPTINHHEAMYSYYFYRLIQRAERVDAIYCSSNVDMRSGEPSRFIHQLRYESPHKCNEKSINVNVSISEPKNNIIKKDDRIIQILSKFYREDSESTLTPSAINRYIECPMSFYYQNVEGLGYEEEEIVEETNKKTCGNIVHKTLEKIYTPLIGMNNKDIKERLQRYTKTEIESIIEEESINELNNAYNKDDGNTIINNNIMIKQVFNALNFDKGRTDNFVIKFLEYKFAHCIDIGSLNVRMGGRIDRVDYNDNNYVIIDYKTGTKNKAVKIEKIIDSEEKEKDKNLVQVLIYQMIWNEYHSEKAIASLYFLKKKDDLKTLDIMKGDDSYQEEFAIKIKSIVAEIFDAKIPFTVTTKKDRCKYCQFKKLCQN